MNDTKAPPRVSVVVPTWNGEAFLPIILESLRHQTFRPFEVLVVDNGSTDGTLALLRSDYPEARVVPLNENRGFAAAVNEGIRAGSGEYVALLNNDVEADPGWLEALVSALDAEPTAGFAASRIRKYWDRKYIDCAGDLVSLSPVGRGSGDADGPEFDRPAWVTTACAAAALYRRSLFDRIGLFNEEFVSYFEDVELGMRAQIAGFRCLYVPDAVAYHMGSATAKRIPKLKVYYGLRNVVQLYFTTFPALYIARYLPRLVASKLWFAMTEGGAGVFLQTLASLTIRLPRMVRRRREIFALRKISDGALAGLLERPRPLRQAVRDKLLRPRVDEAGSVAPVGELADGEPMKKVAAGGRSRFSGARR